MGLKNKGNLRKVFYPGLLLALTVLLYIVGSTIYRTGLQDVRQDVIRVELTDFIENTRYALHFGKDINSFYRMNELLMEQVETLEDLDGLYVISPDNGEIFATDGRELSDAVMRLSDGNRTEGNQFYVGMPLEEDGGSWLIARSTGTKVLLGQSDFIFRFLLFCIAGFLISSVLIFLVLRKRATGGKAAGSPVVVVVIWMIVCSSVMNYGTYAVYSNSIGEMEKLITDSINADLDKVRDMGIKETSVAPVDSFLARYKEAAGEVNALSVDGDGRILITMKSFGGRFVIGYIMITLLFVAIALCASRFAEARILKTEKVFEDEEYAAKMQEGQEGRYSIKRRLQILVVAISATALIVISAIAFAVMLVIRTQSETALINETKSNLSVVAFDTASIVEEKMEKYRDHARFFASVSGRFDVPGRESGISDENATSPVSVKEEGYAVTTIADRNGLDVNRYLSENGWILHTAELILPYLADEDNNIFRVYWGDNAGFLTILGKNEDSVAGDTIYEFRESSWYKAVGRTRDVVFTEVYTDNLGAERMITCAAPYYDDEGEFAGVLGIDVVISNIYEELEKLSLGEGVYAFIVNSQGNVISLSDGDISLEEAEGLDEDAKERLLGSDGSVFERNGIYYTGSKVFVTDWTVCIHAPAGQTLQMVQAIDNEIKTAIVIFILVFAIVLVVVFIIVTNTAAGIADPIIELEMDVRKISGGNLEHRAKVRTNDEVGQLAKSFNEMSGSLKEYIADIREMTAKQERIGAELSVATKIQADMLPSDFSKYADRNDFDLFASMTPAREVGGDFYDFFLIDDDHLGLVMADVSGKGVPAALFMVVARTLIKNCALAGGSPAEILRKVNDGICENNNELLFVTVWLGILDLRTGVLSTADAGHEYPAVRKGDGAAYELVVTEHDAPLGTMEGNTYAQVDIPLDHGDTIFLYTDGASDVKNKSGEKLGIDRFMKCLNSHADQDPKEQVERIRRDLDVYMEGAEPFDDITMMCAQYLGRESTVD